MVIVGLIKADIELQFIYFQLQKYLLIIRKSEWQVIE